MRQFLSIYKRLLHSWISLVWKHAWVAIVLIALSTAASLNFAAHNLGINSDTTDIVERDVPFRQRNDAFYDTFPQLFRTTLVVVSADRPQAANDAAEKLTEALQVRDDLFSSVYYPNGDPFYREHALLYLEPGELERVTERLAEAQPALSSLAQDPSLRGLLDLISFALENQDDVSNFPPAFVALVDEVASVTEAVSRGEAKELSGFEGLLGDGNGGTVYRLITVQGREDSGVQLPSGQVIRGIRQVVDDLAIEGHEGVQVRLTGRVPLAHEEMRSALAGAQIAGIVSLIFLTIILGLGVGSFRIIVATLATLFVGLSWTLAFAAITVGEFNILSIAFAVLFIGLGVDFSIHIALRYQEEITSGAEKMTSMLSATEHTGGAVSLCAVTSAIGFLSFVPTAYSGLGELGLIAGGGMFMALFASFSVLPAVLSIVARPADRGARHTISYISALIYNGVANHNRRIAVTALIVGLITVSIASLIRFDFSVLALKNPNAESVRTLDELQENNILTDYTIAVLAPDMASARSLAERLSVLEVVDHVEMPLDHVPSEQDLKFELLEDAYHFMLPALEVSSPKAPPSVADRLQSIARLQGAIGGLKTATADDPLIPAAKRLGSALDGMTNATQPVGMLLVLEDAVVSGLNRQINWLRNGLQPSAVTFEDLPAQVRDRLVATDGRVRLAVFPAKNLDDFAELGRFVEAVSAVEPSATGRPVVEAGVGEIVSSALVTSIILAFMVISVFVYGTLRSLPDSLLVLAPIVFAGLLTMATAVLLDIHFNFANVILLPLLLGLGVDNGIHVVLRARDEDSVGGMLSSSTPRAVFLSALTTLGSFSSLSLSPHAGIKSMGIMLSFSIIYLVISTIVVLPAIIAWREQAADPDGRQKSKIAPAGSS